MGDERILLRTNRGDLVLALYPDVAPRTRAQILKLVRLGVYDSTRFHRVEPGFVVQLTNAQNRKQPLSPEQRQAIVKLPAEFSALPHRAGRAVDGPREQRPQQRRDVVLDPAAARPPTSTANTRCSARSSGALPLLGLVAAEPRNEQNPPLHELVVESAVVKTDAEIAAMIARRGAAPGHPPAGGQPAAPAVPDRADAQSRPGGLSTLATGGGHPDAGVQPGGVPVRQPLAAADAGGAQPAAGADRRLPAASSWAPGAARIPALGGRPLLGRGRAVQADEPLRERTPTDDRPAAK